MFSVSVYMPSFHMSNIIMLNAVKAEYCFAECHHVDSRYADFRHTIHHYAEFCYTELRLY